MKQRVIGFLSVIALVLLFAFPKGKELVQPVELKPVAEPTTQEAIFLLDHDKLEAEGWAALPQVAFWRRAMQLSPDSSLINIAATRQIISQISSEEYFSKTKKGREAYKDSLRTIFGLSAKDEIYVTTGKNHFYKFEVALPSIPKAIGYFQQQKVDPWYAQAILLIESPNQLQASPVGAYGPFQLMPRVAREHGLVVNKQMDEREDLEKSAMAAASLIQKVCIPKASSILQQYNLDYHPEDIWFRLMVLHVYHAGAGNVSGAVKKIKPKQGGVDLIQQLWQTEYRGFKNASQNYSQVALASMLNVAEMQRGEGLSADL